MYAARSARRIPTSALSRRQTSAVVGKRLASTAPQPSGSSAGYAAAGAAGGAVVLLGVYGWYHYSGAKATIDAARSVRDSVYTAKDKISEKVPSTSEALKFLRSTAGSYAIFIPGGKAYVDQTFDALDQAQQTHGEEVDNIVRGTYDELKKAVESGGADVATAQKVGEVLSRRGKELAEVAKKASGDLLDKYPGAREKLGGAYDQLQALAGQSGEEGKKMMEDVKKQLADIMKSGNIEEGMKKAQDLLNSKKKDMQGMGEQAWQQALKTAKPYLDKMPDIKKALEENQAALMTAMASGSGSLSELWDRVKKTADMGKKEQGKAVEELKQYITEQAQNFQQGGEETWDKLEDFVKSFPGGSQLLQSSPEIQKYASALKEKAPEAQKIAEDTVNEILKVLKEKAAELGKVTDDVKDQKGGK